MHRDKEYLRQAVTAGADGYLLKEDADAELFSAIDRVRRGRIYVSPKLSEELTEDWAKISRGDHKPSFEPEKLTTRERQVLTNLLSLTSIEFSSFDRISFSC
jgi:two-component system, NarL family, response regulator NreC